LSKEDIIFLSDSFSLTDVVFVITFIERAKYIKNKIKMEQEILEIAMKQIHKAS